MVPWVLGAWAFIAVALLVFWIDGARQWSTVQRIAERRVTR
jgi:hypothetical protein